MRERERGREHGRFEGISEQFRALELVLLPILPNMLSCKKLDVYRFSIEFLAVAWELRTSFPRGHGELADPLYRASLSIALNIAEGAGKVRDAD